MFQKIKLFKILYTLISTIATLNLLCSCTSNKYFEIQSNNIIYNGDTKFINDIPDWYRYSTNNLAKLCVSPDFTIIQKVAYVVSCNNELLHRSDVTNSQRLSAIDNYNLSVFNLLQFKLQNKAAKSLSIVLNSKNKSINLNHLTLTTNFELLNKRLSFKEFGELGVVAISEAKNRKKGFDKFYPREGIFRSVNFTFNSLVLVEKQLIVTLNYEIVSEPIYTKLGTQTYLKKYSPSAAYLALLEKADIDNFSLLGLIYATQAEFREGVFAIEPISLTKIPLIMTHGLNSDPLIWRYLTMTLLNDPDINKHFQIWHFYYPSGPPPFFTAMKLRKKVEDLLALTSSNNLVNKAVFVGHSMGGIITHVLASKSDYVLWDSTFLERPEILVDSTESDLKGIFIFDPIFKDNTVFFLDTPHKGSDIASSAIGYISAWLVDLPASFRNVFQAFVKKIGLKKLTKKMQMFGNGPNSIEVLRPEHPIMEALNTLNVNGRAYSIIGSDGELGCKSEQECSLISDSIVSYNSSHYQMAEEEIIVQSTHNSFENEEAIQFIKAKLHEMIREDLDTANRAEYIPFLNK